MAFSSNPEGRPRNRLRIDVRQALMDAYNAAGEANRAIVEALLTDTGDTCSTIIRRAYTQLGYAAANLKKAQTCLNTPPAFQPFLERRRR
jgi:hypothetical protein